MGTVYKPMVSRPLPVGAKVVTRQGREWAEWKDPSGRTRRAPLAGARAKRPGILVESGTFVAKFRDGDGTIRKVATRCKTRDAAERVLADLMARAEKVRAGVLTATESRASDHAQSQVIEHVDAYLDQLRQKRGKGARRQISPTHVANADRALRTLVEECRFVRLRDLNREAVERWVSAQLALPTDDLLDGEGNVVETRRPGARTINAKLTTLTAWGNWLVESGRLTANPFNRLRKLDESDDVRRQRRALTADEMRRLLVAARLRPLAEHGRETIKVIDPTRPARSRATWEKAPLSFEGLLAAAERGRKVLRADVAEALELTGWERALTYLVLMTTGLRRGELAAVTVDDVELDGPAPTITLKGTAAKNGQRAIVPLRPDVAQELQAWLKGRGKRGADHSGSRPLFDVPASMIRVFDLDLAAAGIAKVDERGRTVDVHALRHTFASHLMAAGVAPRTAQAAMRHSSLELTTRTYTDPKLLDVAGAVNSLPGVVGEGTEAGNRGLVTEGGESAVVPGVVPTSGISSPPEAIAGPERENDPEGPSDRSAAKEGCFAVFPRHHQERAKGLEPSTSSLGS